MRCSWNLAVAGSTAKLSTSNNLFLPDTQGRAIGREGESLSPAAKIPAPIFTRGRFFRHASRTASDAAGRNGAGSQMSEINHSSSEFRCSQ